MSDRIRCPKCGTLVPHTHGYLQEHHHLMKRGELTTGSAVCPLSNSRPRVPLKSVKFDGFCPVCNGYLQESFTEQWPGSLDHYGGLLTRSCYDESHAPQDVLLTDHFVIAEPA